MCLRAAPQSEHTPLWMLWGETLSFARCVGFNSPFLGKQKTVTAAGIRNREEMLCALWSAGEERYPFLALFLLHFLACGARKGQLALNASLTWEAGAFGSWEDQGQLFRFAGAGTCVVCGVTPPPLWGLSLTRPSHWATPGAKAGEEWGSEPSPVLLMS